MMTIDLGTLVSFLVGLVLGYLAGILPVLLFGPAGVAGRFKARSWRPETPEERIDKASRAITPHWSKKTVERGIRELEQFYRDQGQQVPSKAELRREAEQLLNASIQGETVV